MTAIVWPAGLPEYVLTDGYDEQGPINVTRTKVDVGPAKSRRRSTVAEEPIAIKVAMTDDQLLIFEDFVKVDLMSGALSFEWMHPRKRTAVTMRIQVGDNKPPYRIAHIGGDQYHVSMVVEVMP